MTRIRYAAFSLACTLSSVANAYDFEQVKETDGITVSKAYVEEKGIYRVRVEALASEPLDGLLELSLDVAHWHAWMPKIIEANYIEPGKQHYSVHIKYQSPWPVGNRDSVTKGEVSKNQDNGAVSVKFFTFENDYPLTDDFVRIPSIDGFWQFTPEEGQTRVVYETEVDPGGSVPKWMVNMEAIDIPFHTVVNLLSEAPSYRDATADWLN